MYVIDSNILIEPSRKFYSFEIAPSFWAQLSAKGATGEIIVIDKVWKEIAENSRDELSEWIKNDFEGPIASTETEEVLASYSLVIQAVMESGQYTDSAKAVFAGSADSWVIAYSLAFRHTLVTQEGYHPEAKNRVMIPNICKDHDIECIDLYELLKKEKICIGR